MVGQLYRASLMIISVLLCYPSCVFPLKLPSFEWIVIYTVADIVDTSALCGSGDFCLDWRCHFCIITSFLACTKWLSGFSPPVLAGCFLHVECTKDPSRWCHNRVFFVVRRLMRTCLQCKNRTGRPGVYPWFLSQILNLVVRRYWSGSPRIVKLLQGTCTLLHIVWSGYLDLTRH